MFTTFGGNSAWGFSNRSNEASLTAFTDEDNSLGLGGSIIEQESATTWLMHLDNSVSYLYDDDDNDIVLRLRLSGGEPTGADASFVVPFDGRLSLQAVGGEAASSGRADFGLGTSPTNFVPVLTGLAPNTSSEVVVGIFTTGDTIHFGMRATFAGNTAWGFSNGSDQPSLVAFSDMDNSLGMGGSILEEQDVQTWLLHLDYANLGYDDDDNDILVRIRLVPSVGPGPVFTSASIGSAGSFLPGLVPGGLIALFGLNLSQGIVGTEEAGGSLLYKGTSVLIGGRLSPILSITNLNGLQQINLQASVELTPGTVTTVQVDNNGSRFTVGGVPVFAAHPGIFEIPFGVESKLLGAVIHLDGQLVTPANPAQHGEIVALFFTGGGAVTPPVPTGALGPIPPSEMTQAVVVGVADIGLPVWFAGAAPGFIGLYQINFEITGEIPSGDCLKLNIKVGETFSQDSSIAVQ